MIGDRVPIPVTSFNTANTVGGNIVPITSFQYQDVGITINIEPRVHHNKEVTLKLTVEVSQVSGQVSGGGGQASQPIIGTRTIESTIRLKDGETNFLAGLIRQDNSFSDTGVPGLSDIPVIGRLFSKNSTDNRRTDVILTLTPHIVRLPDITEEDLLPIWVGTEQNITFRGGSPRVESDVDGPFDGPDQTSPEEIRRRIRERLQSLPRGLQGNDNGAQQQEQEPPSGQELVPGLPSNQSQPEPPPPGSLQQLQQPQADLDDGSGRRRSSGDTVDDIVADATELASMNLADAAAFGRFAAVTSSPLATTTDVELRLVPAAVTVSPGDTLRGDPRGQGADPGLPSAGHPHLRSGRADRRAGRGGRLPRRAGQGRGAVRHVPARAPGDRRQPARPGAGGRRSRSGGPDRLPRRRPWRG